MSDFQVAFGAGLHFSAEGTIAPEPNTALLVVIGLVGLATTRRRRIGFTRSG